MMYLETLNQKLRDFNQPKDAKISGGRLNSRADQKFDFVISTLSDTLQDGCSIEKQDICCAELKYQSISTIMQYEMKNMLLSRNYDLVFQSEFGLPISAASECIDEDFQIGLKYDGIIKMKDVKFYVQTGDRLAKRVVDAFNIPLILERVLRLEVSNINIIHHAKENVVTLRLETLRGSATWSMFPPVFQLIPLKRKDCFDLIEFLQISKAVISGLPVS